MGWVLVLLVALLTGGVGLLLGGVVMAACVRWFRVSSFEGKSGYAIVAMALLGLIVGFLVGLITALTLPADASLPFLRALGIAVGLVAGAAGLAALVARLMADVPPRLDGRELLLDVEVRLPAGQTQLPDIPADQAYVELGALKGRVRRRAVRGPLRLDEARLEDGRLVVPGSADVFTSRGKRVLMVQLGEEPMMGFLVPLPARPRREHLSWSGWLPQPKPPAAPWPDDKASFRFRVRLEDDA
ncbi:MAG: hypothetical protein H6826_04025 [Planctomycetes bacterium]|nr:hypothetical protein [Planctomycetota bacterium]MCB9900500.1 hypothetical protein [Planctomycetota bacterium]